MIFSSEFKELSGSQHTGWYFPQALRSLHCHVLDGYFLHDACDTTTQLGTVKRHLVSQLQGAFGSLRQSSTSIFHSIHNAGQLIVGKVALQDCGVDCFDIHLELLFAAYVYIIVAFGFLVNQKVVVFLQQFLNLLLLTKNSSESDTAQNGTRLLIIKI